MAELTDQMIAVKIVLLKENQKAEANSRLSGKEIFAVTSFEGRLFDAIDAIVNKLARQQIGKHKVKRR